MERWQQIESLFQEALQRPGAERDAFLRQACGGDADLLREVQSRVGQAVPEGTPPANSSLEPGQSLGPYQIVSFIAAGGMGSVYRARDPRMGREVAIKVAAERFSERFSREVRAVAALNHPNICHVYDVGPNYLVMELVEGESPKGPLPLEEALRIARQIADALEEAHEKGIVHRDLKPGNIKIRPDGTVKVLDFGLAKVAQASAHEPDPQTSPTLTISPTRVGMILGTAAYMSPEQARGKPVDNRADIWSFGAVLYEILTGKQAFGGESVSDTLASVLKLDPDWDRLPANTPGAVRKLLRRCLTKDRRQRLQAIGEARIAIEEVTGGKAEEVETTVRSLRSRLGSVGWIAAAIILSVALWGWLRPAPPAPRSVVRLTTTLPVANVIGAIALSRDGSRLAFVGGPHRQIYVRMMDQLEAKPIPGTEEASSICFSPDGQWISYFGGTSKPKLMKIAVAGGPAQVLVDAVSAFVFTQDWGSDDNILFTGNGGSLMRIPAAGGTPQTLATPDPKSNEMFLAGPQLLPGGKQVLVNIARSGGPAGRGGQLAALNLQTGEKKILIDHAVAVGRYLPTGPGPAAGHIVYYTPLTGSLMAAAFDASRMEVKGSPVPVLDGVQGYGNSPFALLGVSDSGTLAYVAGDQGPRSAYTLVWVDRKGVEQPLPAPPRAYGSPRLSPDGQRIALGISDLEREVWVYDLARGTLQNVTSGGYGYSPIWTPDGKRLIYAASNGTSVVWAPFDGSSPPSILTRAEKGAITPTSVSPDGKLIGYYPTSGDLWVLPLPEGSSGETKPQAFLDSRVRKVEPAFSADGRWVAYRSDETGNREIWVVPYPGPGGQILISTDGGATPRWSHDGRELFYRNGDRMMAVDVQTSPAFRAGTPKVLFKGTYASAYDVSPDGKRFLMIKPPATAQAPTDQVTVVVNWFEELHRRVPVEK